MYQGTILNPNLINMNTTVFVFTAFTIWVEEEINMMSEK